jgi:hypothetical protein
LKQPAWSIAVERAVQNRGLIDIERIDGHDVQGNGGGLVGRLDLNRQPVSVCVGRTDHEEGSGAFGGEDSLLDSHITHGTHIVENLDRRLSSMCSPAHHETGYEEDGSKCAAGSVHAMRLNS